MGGLAITLASILTILYSRTREHDDSSYFENVALLRQLKQLDASWELDVLKSKMGIDTNYDPLVEPLVELNQLREKLQSVVTHQRVGADEMANRSKAFYRAINDKTRLIEHFKSHNAVLRNSLAFLPTAKDDIQRAASQSRGDQPALAALSAGVSEVLLDSMVFSQAPIDNKAADIRIALEHIEARQEQLPLRVRDALDIFASHVRTVLREQLEVKSLLSGIAAVPTAASIDAIDNLLSSGQREIQQQAQQHRRQLLMFAAALAALFLYAMIKLIRTHAVVNRVNKALQGANSALKERIDEVQERTRELHETQSELIATSREAGMAEIASSVLHNVGNVLNSVNVSAGLVAQRIKRSKGSGVARVAGLLDEHAGALGPFLESPQGRHLPVYLRELAVELANEQSQIAAELEELRRNIDHIKEIVAMQQGYAKRGGLTEIFDVRTLVEDSLRMNAEAFTRHGVALVREFSDVPAIRIDKHKVLQILVNLIRNAKFACEESHGSNKCVTVRIAKTETSVLISIMDTGVGIPAENLTRIFNHGFTTRAAGHGFGLHSSALAATDSGGSLRAASLGLGRGSTFTLELPLIHSEALDAA